MTKQGTLALPEVVPDMIVEQNHRYRLVTGGIASDWVPGVTGILKVQSEIGGSDGLVNWAVGLAAKAAFDTARMPESPDFQTALQAAIAATEEPKNKGVRIHAGVEDALLGQDHIPTQADGLSWYHWSRFLLAEKPEIHAVEQYVFGDGYGGTYDMDATVRGKRSLIDIKSGKYKDTFPLQLAAYGACRWQAPKGVGQPVVRVPAFEAYFVLMLGDDGYQLLEQEVGPAEVEHFRFLVRTHQQLRAWNARKKEKAA